MKMMFAIRTSRDIVTRWGGLRGAGGGGVRCFAGSSPVLEDKKYDVVIIGTYFFS